MSDPSLALPEGVLRLRVEYWNLNREAILIALDDQTGARVAEVRDLYRRAGEAWDESVRLAKLSCD